MMEASSDEEMYREEMDSNLSKGSDLDDQSIKDFEQDSDQEDGDQDSDLDMTEPARLVKPLSSEKLLKFQAKLEASGVVYLSRIPPFMKPTKLRSLLAKYGKLGRIYLAPEDPKVTARRKKYKHNKRQNYVEGWVEFLDKKVARSTAQLLNSSNIGGKKRSYYYDDIWNMKYLPRFKWNHLTEQIAYELKVREHKLKTELSQAKRENKMYVKNVEKAKMIEGMQEKKRAKASEEPKSLDQIKRSFKQRRVMQETQPVASTTKGAALLSRMFS